MKEDPHAQLKRLAELAFTRRDLVLICSFFDAL